MTRISGWVQLLAGTCCGVPTSPTGTLPASFNRACRRRPSAPSGTYWVYEIKHDGYRLIVRKAGDRVRIFTRRGADWSHRFPRIVEAVSRLRASSMILDGEGVICGQDGVSNFNALHSVERDDDVMLYAFDLLETARTYDRNV